jgi:hypothetical protein
MKLKLKVTILSLFCHNLASHLHSYINVHQIAVTAEKICYFETREKYLHMLRLVICDVTFAVKKNCQ